MSSVSDFGKLVPGFEFLQSLAKNAGAAMPGIGQWVAPTLDPAELSKRIDELRTVQFWLEQNAKLLATTIQALEVQRMTLSTLKTMNVQMADLQESLKIKPAAAEASATKAASTGTEAKAGAPAVDPMQWWGALTDQFTQLAAGALKDTAAAGAPPARPQPGASLQRASERRRRSLAAPRRGRRRPRGRAARACPALAARRHRAL